LSVRSFRFGQNRFNGIVHRQPLAAALSRPPDQRRRQQRGGAKQASTNKQPSPLSHPPPQIRNTFFPFAFLAIIPLLFNQS
jgi:hypothetical protein